MKNLKCTASVLLLFAFTSISVTTIAQRRRLPQPSRERISGSSNENSRLTGTYHIESKSSEDVRAAAERATSNLPAGEQQSVIDEVTARLGSPAMLAIERSGSAVSFASSHVSRTSFDSDGKEYVGLDVSGRRMGTRATLYGDLLEISSSGNGSSDLNVTFESVDGGRRLDVTRRIYPDQLDQAIIVRSFYVKTSNLARWDIYDGAKTYNKGSGAEVQQGSPFFSETKGSNF